MESISLKTRKPVDRLRRGDFDAFPIWEYADDEEGEDGRDETWVRPVESKSVPRRSYCHVAADFITPTAKTYFGFVTVSTLNGAPELCHGVILYNRKYLIIAKPGAYGFENSRKELLRIIGLEEEQAFPLSFTLRVPVNGHVKYRGGTLP